MRKPAWIDSVAFWSRPRGPRRCRAAACVVGVAMLIAGCAKTAHRSNPCAECVTWPRGICAGYYPTCWRLWPGECPTCPLPIDQQLVPAGLPAPPLPGGEQLPNAPLSEEAMPAPPQPAGESPPSSSGKPPAESSPAPSVLEPPATGRLAVPDSSRFAARDSRRRSVVQRSSQPTRRSPARAAK